MGVCSLTFVAQSKGVIMRSAFYGTLLTVFVACAGAVQAASDLEGKSLLCTAMTKLVRGCV